MSLSVALKDATAQAHRDAESREMQKQLVSGGLSETVLRLYLVQLRHLHAALERHLDAHPEVAQKINFADAARHSRRLDADLAALGVEDETIAGPPLPATQRLLAEIDAEIAEEPATALGFFYVLEGSMNGNRFIARALRHTPAGERCDFTYFDPYGEAQPQRWAEFKTALERVQLEPAQEERVLAAAQRLFAGIAEISDEAVATEAPAPRSASTQ
jgi:heme oxygenase